MRNIVLFSIIFSLSVAAHAQPATMVAPAKNSNTMNGAKPGTTSHTAIDPVTGKTIILLGFDGPGKGFKPEKATSLGKKSAKPDAADTDTGDNLATKEMKKDEPAKETESNKETKLRSDSTLRSDASLARDKRDAEEKAAAAERAKNAPKPPTPPAVNANGSTTTTPAPDAGLPLLPATPKP